jgi:predicted nucleic acid binding AN1-type Zn finger protein
MPWPAATCTRARTAKKANEMVMICRIILLMTFCSTSILYKMTPKRNRINLLTRLAASVRSVAVCGRVPNNPLEAMAEREARPEEVRGKRRCKRAEEEGADHGNGKREVRTWSSCHVDNFHFRCRHQLIGNSDFPIFRFSRRRTSVSVVVTLRRLVSRLSASFLSFSSTLQCNQVMCAWPYCVAQLI